MKNLCLKSKNILVFALIIKIIILFLITYFNLSKGEAGALIHYTGAFLCNGNTIIGLVIFGLIFLTYLTGSAIAVIFCKNNNRKFIILSVILDIIFILLNLFGGIYISANLYGMDLPDALSKYSILTCGSGIVFIILSIILIILSFV